MERVAFLIEESGDRIGCLLNPESIVLKRRAGVRTQQVSGGLVTGSRLADDPLLFTGGGTTELTLDLLFDTELELGGPGDAATDVRELTGPLWELAENGRQGKSQGRPAKIRFVWGKAWNVPGIVTAVAERLEYFSADGVPRRSWLRLRLLRVAETGEDLSGGAIPLPRIPEGETEFGWNDEPEHWLVHEIIGDQNADGSTRATERLDQLAFDFFGIAAGWRVLAEINGITNPLGMDFGYLINITPGPPPAELEP